MAAIRISKREFARLFASAKELARCVPAARVQQALAAVFAWERRMAKSHRVFVPGRLRNPLNTRRFWRPVAKDEKAARKSALVACKVARVSRRVPVVVLLTRYGPRKMDKGCGLNAALKPIRDGVADYFGKNDGDETVYDWRYAQAKAPRGCYGATASFEYVRVPQ